MEIPARDEHTSLFGPILGYEEKNMWPQLTSLSDLKVSMCDDGNLLPVFFDIFGGWTRTLNFEMMRRAFYHCATVTGGLSHILNTVKIW